MNAGQKLLEKIIQSKLFSVSCPASPKSACLVTWSSGASEQLEAMVLDIATDIEISRMNVVGLADDGPDHKIAQLACGHYVRFHKQNRINFLIPCPVCPGRKPQ